MSKTALASSASQACDLLRALAHPHRLLMVCHLLDGPLGAGALAAQVGVSQPNASQHLAQLRQQGLVRATRQAQSIVYSIASEPLRQILDILHATYCADKSTPRKGRKAC